MKKVILLLGAFLLSGCGFLQKNFTLTEKQYVVIKPDNSMIAPCYKGKSNAEPLDVEKFVEMSHPERLNTLFKTNLQSLEALRLCDLQFEELGKWYTQQEKLYQEKKK